VVAGGQERIRKGRHRLNREVRQRSGIGGSRRGCQRVRTGSRRGRHVAPRMEGGYHAEEVTEDAAVKLAGKVQN